MTSTQVLAYIPSPPQGVWYVGPLALRAYALCIIVGIVVAIVWGDRRWVARGGEKGTVLDIAVWAVPFGLIGGRLYHVMTDWPTYFGEGGRPADALKIWQGGLGIWGAVALGAVGAWIGCRRRGIPLPAFGDAIAPAILLAQAIGRFGNYFNQELYGRETTVPWGLEIFYRSNDAGQVSPSLIDGVSTGEVAFVVHPTFLYEALWNVLVVIALVWVDRRFRIGHGRLFALYVAGYCAGRFWIELMRTDHASLIAGVRVNSFTSAIVFVLAVVYFLFATKGREDPAELRSAKPASVVGEISENGPDGKAEDESESVSADKSDSGETELSVSTDAETSDKKDEVND
ncbi:prolipoprotein diacylglyceryl transferase [Rhodococcus sp. WMMA185]|uniref:prolipoprotein diacylglyceryl transferase n=1 Tax=Rhodococcus sp. WMMA185 TaxID=679318 RepID=UPI000878C871|nr:prolipoprotein diacylglyceryl transferase [Rhodococcus sp. WMMA185]